MPKDENAAGGHNVTRLKKDIIAARDRINKAKSERTNNNDEIRAAISDLEAKGVHKEAFKIAMKYADWDQDKRENFDMYLELVREAFDLPMNIQGELFQKAKDQSDAPDEEDATPEHPEEPADA